MASRTSSALEIRKLRKKLRQIENLERKEGDLLDEELTKISKKTEIREQLLQLLATAEDDNESFEASTQSNVTNNSNGSSDTQDFEMSAVNITVVTPENEEDDSYVDVESVDVDMVEEVSTPRSTDFHPQVEEVSSTANVSPRKNEADLTPERGAQIEQNSPYQVSPRESIHSDNDQGRIPPKEKTKTKKSKKTKNESEESPPVSVSSWREGMFYLTELEGHNDLITDSDIQGTTLVTASRDTTIKMWNLEEMREVRSFGGHTGSVNTVVLLSAESTAKICEVSGLPQTEGRIIISGSTDCSFKLWCSATGKILRSTYTFSPVTRVVYHPVAEVFITGSDGGKLEMWDIHSGKSVQSLHAFEDSVSALQVNDICLYAASVEGLIKVYEIRDKHFICVFESGNVRSTDGSYLCCRGIRGMAVRDDVIYYGDDGTNVKALSWKSGLVHKLGNHNEDFGITDSLDITDDILISSAFCLDTGLGYINVRNSDGEKYLASLNDGETDRIMSVCCSKMAEDAFAVVSAGVQLKVWIKTSDSRVVLYPGDHSGPGPPGS
ncbi:F-box/WD repeat-containing protein 7-like isoform X2 [Saccostrea cucullata]|uniref:F-box/WD repeat-containing protein 7-like isoform X2 n=1 Tax=Saccostrea cuccullata TaxID=36930 RepID=UPI002ED22837